MTSIATIQRVVAAHHKITVELMLSKSRRAGVVWPRQVAMYLARKLTPESLHAIARSFQRDYTTVHYAFMAVTGRMEVDAKERVTVGRLEEQISDLIQRKA